MDHVGCGGEHRGVRSTIHFRMGLPDRGRLRAVVVVYWFLLADRIHDATQRRLTLPSSEVSKAGGGDN